MAITLQFVDEEYMLSDGIAGEVILDMNDGEHYAYMLDSFAPDPAAERQFLVDPLLADGTRYAPELAKLENLTIPLAIRVTADSAEERYERVMALIRAARDHYNYLLFRPSDDGEVTYYDIVPPAEINTERYWRYGEQRANMAVVEFALSVSPGYGTARELVIQRTIGTNDSFELTSGDNFTGWKRTEDNGSAKPSNVQPLDGSTACSLSTLSGGGEAAVEDASALPVNEMHHYGAVLHAREASGTCDLSLSVTCFDSTGFEIGVIDFPATFSTPANVWQNALPAGATIYPSTSHLSPRFPAGTAAVARKYANTASGASTVYLDKLWFGSVEYLTDRRPGSVCGVAIPPGCVDGDIPAPASIVLKNPYLPSPFIESGIPMEQPTAVSMADADNGWVVGRAAHIIHTTDGWQTYDVQQSGIPLGQFHDVVAVNPLVAWAVGADSKIIKTTDGGATWNMQTNPAVPYDHSVLGVDAINASVAWAVGQHGTIYRTTDGGGTWIKANSGTTEDLYAVCAIDASTVYAVGDNFTVLKATDGGTVWSAVHPSGGAHLRAVSGVSTDAVYFGGYGGTIYKITNAAPQGIATIWNNPDMIVNSLSAVSEDVCYGACLNSLIRTTDGMIWSVLPKADTDNQPTVFALDATTVFFALWREGSTGVIYSGLQALDDLPLTRVMIGQRDGAYFPTYSPVRRPTAGAPVEAVGWVGGTYREFSAGEVNKFLFDLASHSRSGYALSAGLALDGASGHDDADISLYLETVAGDAITPRTEQDTAKIASKDGTRREVIFGGDGYNDMEELPNFLVLPDAEYGNINQVIELAASGSLGGVKLRVDSLSIIPTDLNVEVSDIDTKSLIIDSRTGFVFDSLDGSSSDMAHDPSKVTGTARFELDPLGVNMTIVGADAREGADAVSFVDISVRYRPRTAFHL